MRTERQTDAEHQRQEMARHSVVVTQGIDAPMKPVGLDRESVKGRCDGEDGKGVWASAWITKGGSKVRAENRKDEARYRLPPRSLGFGILGTLALHRPALKGFVISRCLFQTTLARGQAAAILASFALIAWVMLRGLT